MGNDQKLGLALGGGGALGWAHLGVLQVMKENDLTPEVITGTSIGSLVGGCEAAAKTDALESIAKGMTRLGMMKFADVQIGKNGFLGGDPVMKELRHHLGKLQIEDLTIPFGAMAVDLVTGMEVPMTSGDLVEAIRASISIPGVFTPIRRGEKLLVDGGLLNNVPVSLCRDLGASKVIGVDITSDFEGRAASSGVLNGAADHAARQMGTPATKTGQAFQALSDSVAKYFNKGGAEPSTLGISLTSIALIMRELGRAQLAACPPDVVLEPKLGHITMIEFDRADEMIALGREAAEEKLDALKALVSS